MTSPLERVFSVDLRSLAVFRVVVALALLGDLAIRAQDLVVHYTDLGILPRASFDEHPVGRLLPYVSLHFASGHPAWTVALFALAALLALALLVGFRARWAALGSWLLLLSLQHRNPLVIYGGDNLLAVVLFWCPFLPLGARWSWDARRGRGSRAERVFSVASAGLLIQIAAAHFFSVFHKTGAEWWSEGSAVFYAVHIDNLARPLGVALREAPWLLALLSWGTLALEGLGSLLLFSPWRFVPCRMLAVAGFASFHLGLALSLDLLLFNWMGAAFMSVFLPPWFWRRALPRAAPPDPQAPGPRLSRLARVTAAAALAFVLAWNVLSLRPAWRAAAEGTPGVSLLMGAGHLVRLGQVWFMFAPHPPRYTYWNVVEGVLADGRRVDLLRGGGEPSFEKPAAADDYYPSARWERVFANASADPYVNAYRSLARYWCRQPRGGGPPLEQVRIWTRREETLPDGSRRLHPARRIGVWRCGAAAGRG